MKRVPQGRYMKLQHLVVTSFPQYVIIEPEYSFYEDYDQRRFF